jgi:amidase
VSDARLAAGEEAPFLVSARAAKDIELLSRELTAPWGRDFDVLVTPTMAIPPAPAGAIMAASHANPAEPSELVVATVAFTAFSNVTGQPVISLPVHETDDGVPVGAQLTGAPFDEVALLRLAGALEQALPWADRRPAAQASV